LPSIVLAYILAGAAAYLGYRAGALSGSGAVAGCIVGGTVFGFGGSAWAILLIIFFVSSSALSFFKASDARKRAAAQTFEKGGRRDAAQVLANGGVGALIAFLSWLAPQSVYLALFAAYAGTLAAATADTWATEVGVLSKRRPRLITTGRPVPPGTSGGVTWLGSTASFAGALFLGLCAALVGVLTLAPLSATQPFVILLAASAGGVAGSLVDSLLGATVQAAYWCPQCQQATESSRHRCGTESELVRGLPQVNNDIVNLLATLLGALVAGVISLVMYNWVA
jgi:uncharacterized protein (TIGR00297 family)